jgi:hypothetical protein
MKRGLRASLIILAICFSAYGQQHSRSRPSPAPRITPILNPEGWVTFNSESGRFSILVPEIPSDKTEIIQSEHGPYTSHLFKVHGEKSLFVIAWVDYDPSFNFNPALEMEKNRDDFIRGIKATLINNRNVTIDGYESLEFTAETVETVFKSRVYMVGRRPYQLLVGTAKGVDDSSNANRFFDSFKVRLP